MHRIGQRQQFADQSDTRRVAYSALRALVHRAEYLPSAILYLRPDDAASLLDGRNSVGHSEYMLWYIVGLCESGRYAWPDV